MRKFYFGKNVQLNTGPAATVLRAPEALLEIKYDPAEWLLRYPHVPPRNDAFPRSDKIECFCTIANSYVKQELGLMLFSLRQFHQQPIYILGDEEVAQAVGEWGFSDVVVHQELNADQLEAVRKQYFDYKQSLRWSAVINNSLPCFLKKMDVLELCMRFHSNALYLDADTLVVNKLDHHITKDIILSPHYWLSEQNQQRFGVFNAGMLFCADRNFPKWWAYAFFNRSIFCDQQCLNLVEQEFTSVDRFDESYNFGCRRMQDKGLNSTHTVNEKTLQLSELKASDDIYYRGKPVKTFHVHFKVIKEWETFTRTLVLFLLTQSTKTEHKAITQALQSIPKQKKNLPGKLGIIFCYFRIRDAVTSKRNCLQFTEQIKATGLPYHFVELRQSWQDFVIPADQNTTRVVSDSTLFHKERLLNIALAKLPDEVDKVAWIDADIIFQNPNWVQDTCEMLEEYPVGQLFEAVINNDAQNLPSECNASMSYKTHTHSLHGLHQACRPGYAWAARRDWLDKHKLFDFCVTGCSDSWMFLAFKGWFDTPFSQVANPAYMREFLKWAKPVSADIKGRVGYVKGTVIHLYHGSLRTRQYHVREKWVNLFDPTNDLRLNNHNCWEWTDANPTFKSLIENSLKVRDED